MRLSACATDRIEALPDVYALPADAAAWIAALNPDNAKAPDGNPGGWHGATLRTYGR